MGDGIDINTIEDQLDLLESTKTNIKQAIIDKGQTVTDLDTFASYANKIEAITTGEMTEEEYNEANELLDEILGVENL